MPRQVSSDTPGRVSDDVRDPPGQQVVYIPPGDIMVEAYRVSTFENFPVHITSWRRSLARTGFFFTGFHDRVKCFACGRFVQEWKPVDNPADRKYHKDDCPFMRGEYCGNVPITTDLSTNPGHWRMANVISADHKRFLTNLYLNRELDRLASFARWPTGRPNVSPAALARTGLFYLGDMDRTQCFSCGGVLGNWAHGNDAASEHRARYPNCRLLLGTETRNVPVPDLPVPPEVRQRDFPCRFPLNPHMRSEAARVETFHQRWPRNRTAATPAEIAQAGFFCLGERDRVKCWYCNGGLQNWEYGDVPWIEHAKWFPNCQYLLNVKGQHFVHQHLAKYPHLPRPGIARQDGSGLERNLPKLPEHIPPTVARAIQPCPPPTSIDTQEMRKKQERIDNVLENSEVVKYVLAMGFSAEIVLQVLVEKVFSGGEDNLDNYGSSQALVEDIVNTLKETEQEECQRPNGYMPTLLHSPSTAPEDEVEQMEVDETSKIDGIPPNQVEGENDNTALQEALNKIEEERICKVCFDGPAEMVFEPCSHVCCCVDCTLYLEQCPVCRAVIQRAKKVYFA